MKYKPPKYKTLAEMAAIDVGRLTEDEARTILENIRWPQGPVCPHCGGVKATRLHSNPDAKTRDGVIQCNDCRGQYTVTTSTVMHGSHITLRQWVQAFYSMASHKKGVSALQLQRNLGLRSYQSAWHLAHRIRLAMCEGPFANKLNGTVEVDEAYIGGKPRPGHCKGFAGRGTAKQPVLVLVQRDGNARGKVIPDVKGETLKNAIRENVEKSARIMTDEYYSYRGIGNEFDGGHFRIEHGTKVYSRGDIYTNTAESYFALLKRGVIGTFHAVSKKHLHRYMDEFSFRWNTRKVNDGQRATEAIRNAAGKRLKYAS